MSTLLPLLDISPVISPTLPVWPGDTSFRAETTWEIENGCPVKVSRITLSTHTGAHCDAPAHYDPAGASIDAVALDAYIGACRVIDCVDVRRVEPHHVAHALQGVPPRVLLRTYAIAPRDNWDAAFAHVATETIALLAQHGVTLIGIAPPFAGPAGIQNHGRASRSENTRHGHP